MSLLQLAAADLVTILEPGDWGQVATYTTASAGTFVINVVVGDAPTDAAMGMGMTSLGEQAMLVVASAALLAGLTAAGEARDPLPGERLTIGAAAWIIETWNHDEGGATTLRCRRSDGAIIGGARRITA